MLKAILFDIDGTLVDSNDLHIAAWDEVFRSAGHQFHRRALHDQVGKGGDNYVPSLLPDISDQEAERLADEHGRIYKQRYIAQARPFPDARDLLLRCREAGYKIVLASSASGEELDHYLKLLDAAQLVDAHTSADDVGPSKPCPDIFVSALQKAGAEPDEALVVGDTPYDIEAANGAGTKTIAVRSGKFPDEALAGAIAIFDDVAQLLARFNASPLSRVEEAV
ncbi:HAD family hydrolase [uncultured Sphingomonas sp.]|uniref:HAD family hydrolase n=1 Tax=uncultured Sphingomonas sp. TaxID=158754 RepID=UPI0025DE3FDA|nr:HAD family hydrolase [uncultured Sphingomonas sp.]